MRPKPRVFKPGQAKLGGTEPLRSCQGPDQMGKGFTPDFDSLSIITRSGIRMLTIPKD